MRSLADRIIQQKYCIVVLLIMAVGFLVRVYNFGSAPAGFNQDEAFAAYEAYSILNYGVDSCGYTLPTYFVAWGSGMNVLESYLAIPFMWLFGCNEVAFRMPQLIAALCSLPVFYLLLKKLFGNGTALAGLAVLSIAPWHIMLSRWGLESNLAPAFILFGLFFLIKGRENNGWFMLSALFLGISLYSYAITWPVVLLLLVAVGPYVLVHSVKRNWMYVVCAVVILAILALPHILFLLVNQGAIPEIKTAFISIPKLVAERSGEISLRNLFSYEAYKNYFSVLLFQTDGLPWNSAKGFGMFYGISALFLILGLVNSVRGAVRELKKKCFSGYFVLLVCFVIVSLVCLLLKGANINKMNSLHLFTAALIAVGIWSLVRNLRLRYIKAAVALCYALYFILFCGYYFTDYQKEISSEFRQGVGEAVALAEDMQCQKVAVDISVYHSQIMFYDKIPQKLFSDTVEYYNYPSPYLSAKSFGRYTFGINYNDLGGYDAYVIPVGRADCFNGEEFEVYPYGCYALAVPKSE